MDVHLPIAIISYPIASPPPHKMQMHMVRKGFVASTRHFIFAIFLLIIGAVAQREYCSCNASHNTPWLLKLALSPRISYFLDHAQLESCSSNTFLTHSHEHAESEANMTAKLQIAEFRADLYEALDKPELINASPELIKLPSARR